MWLKLSKRSEQEKYVEKRTRAQIHTDLETYMWQRWKADKANKQKANPACHLHHHTTKRHLKQGATAAGHCF